ncbi:NAD(P)/FAD-dependent oxidoreductase [Geomicrobium sp. JSM 1781026]|uniref:NAD(P)/FAD-dependent oxidoreductase n=1 Tax=Geomicrobium sp. JSM 1781026 TaxID=3344580 RepID=UPI0035BEF022
MKRIIIIGGGPSGLMAAVSAATEGAHVTIVDKGTKLGRKLAISGGGRCNVTNRMELGQLISFIPGNGKFMHSPFSVFNNEDIIAYFENLGIRLKEEDMGRMFPVTDKAQTVVETLLREIKRLGVTIQTNQRVKSLIIQADQIAGIRLENGQEQRADAVIVATGGTSVPHTGSTGDAYPWAKAAGHTVTDLYPTEVPITLNEPFIKSKTVQGLSLRDVQMTVWNKKKKTIVTHEGDVLFTHFGLSGPIALRCSQYVVKERKKHPENPVTLTIDLYPETSVHKLVQQFEQRKSDDGAKSIKNALSNVAPERYLALLLEHGNVDKDMPLRNVTTVQLEELARLFKAFPLRANGTLSIEKAFVTGGGVSIKEIVPKTMASKKKRGLYFCGEVLDIHGYTGGFNITVAFSTGYTAGKNAALDDETPS